LPGCRFFSSLRKSAKFLPKSLPCPAKTGVQNAAGRETPIRSTGGGGGTPTSIAEKGDTHRGSNLTALPCEGKMKRWSEYNLGGGEKPIRKRKGVICFFAKGKDEIALC